MNIKYIFLFLFTMILFPSCGNTNWVKRSKMRIPDGINVSIIGVCGEDTIYVGGPTRERSDGLTFYYTTDKGRNWRKGASIPDGLFFSELSDVLVDDGLCWGEIHTEPLGGERYLFRYDARLDTIQISSFKDKSLTPAFYSHGEVYFTIRNNKEDMLARIHQDLFGFDYICKTRSDYKRIIPSPNSFFYTDYLDNLYVGELSSVDLGDIKAEEVLFATDSTCLFSGYKEDDVDKVLLCEYHTKTATCSTITSFEGFDYIDPVLMDRDNMVLIGKHIGKFFFSECLLISSDRGETWRVRKMPLSGPQRYLYGKTLYVDGLTSIDIYHLNF